MTSVILICGAILGLVYLGGLAVENLDRFSVRTPAGLALQTVGFLAVVFAGVSGGVTTLISAALIMAVLRYMWRVEASLVVGGFVGVLVQAFSTRHIGNGELTALGLSAIGIGVMFVGMVMMPSKHIAKPIAHTNDLLASSVKAMRNAGWAFSRGTKTEKPSRFSALIAAMKNPLPMVKAAKAAKPAKAKAAKAVKTKASKPTKSVSSGSDADSSILTRIEAMTKPATADEVAAEEVLEELEATATDVLEDVIETDDSVPAETKIQDDAIIAELEKMLKGEI